MASKDTDTQDFTANKTIVPTPPAVEIATSISDPVKMELARQALAAEGGSIEVSEVLRDRIDEVFAFILRVLNASGMNATFSIPPAEEAKDCVNVELSEAGSELSPEMLQVCLRGLESDFNRGIVVIDENAEVEAYQATLEKDRTARTTWEVVQERLLANDSALLKKAATMQGQGELIGVFQNGELCIIDRGDKDGNREPVIIAFDAENNRITITSDTPDRANAMGAITGNGGKFADYWEIREAVMEDGFTLPPDSPAYEKKGIVAAAEALSGKPFVRSENGEEWRSAILECGNVSRDADVRVVRFYPKPGLAYVSYIGPCRRHAFRGAVRVLRG